MRKIIVIGLLLAAAGGGGFWWWYTHREQGPQELVLYGNVDLRQAQLAFNNSERIAEVLVQEGDRVKRHQLLLTFRLPAPSQYVVITANCTVTPGGCLPEDQ